MQRMGSVRTVLHIVPLEPLGSRGTGDIEDLSGLAVGQSESLISCRIFGVVRAWG